MYLKIAFLSFSIVPINICNAAEARPLIPLKKDRF
jgi:hypothetical protein